MKLRRVLAAQAGILGQSGSARCFYKHNTHDLSGGKSPCKAEDPLLGISAGGVGAMPGPGIRSSGWRGQRMSGGRWQELGRGLASFHTGKRKGDSRSAGGGVPPSGMSPLGWSTRKTGMMIVKGAGAATLCSTVVAGAAVAMQEEPSHCDDSSDGKPPVSIPSNIGGVPVVMDAPHAAMSAVSSNSFWEDRCVATWGAGKELYFAVLDGHGGWDCAEFAYAKLPTSISDALSTGGYGDVEGCIMQGFLKVEEMWVNRLKTEWLREPNYVTYGAPGTERLSSVGSCVLLACVHGGMLYVANLGDSRAVIAQKGFGGSYRAQRVTSDLNAMNTAEQERLRRDHPGEPDIFRCRGPYSCYVKGCLQPTYSLGDAYLKYSHFNHFPGRVVPDPYKPPYIRSAPQITTRPLASVSEGDFLILASDGVWDYLSDQNAVDLVNRARKRGTSPAEAVVEATLELAAARFGISREQLISMPTGRQRRRIHDDATVIVVDLHSAAVATAGGARSKL